MSAGTRRERIQIKRKARVQRVDGGWDTSVSIVSTRWAAVKPVRATEGEEAGRKRGAVTYLIEVDSRGADVRTDDLIVWITGGDATMNVREVRTPARRSLPLEIVAEAGVINGGT